MQLEAAVMKSGFRRLLQAVAIGIAALIVINVSAFVFPASERAVTLIVVVAGTALLAALRWEIWPFQRQKAAAQQDNATPTRDLAEPEHTPRLRLKMVAGLLLVLLLMWIAAMLVWMSYEDAESRSFILQGLARATGVVVSLAILAMPPFQKGSSRASYQLALTILLALGWFAGSILLPSVCKVLWGSCYDIDEFVLAIPGWSFVPIAALLLRSIGARLGIMSWRTTEQEQVRQ